MLSPQFIFFILAVIDLMLGGLISNCFIITVILREWTTSRSLASTEQFFLSLSLTNLGATVVLIPSYINAYIFPIFTRNFIMLIVYPLDDFLVLSRHWFTAWLIVFYCIKIVNSTHSLFLWCKLKISWLVPWLIAGSLVVSLFFALFKLYIILMKIQSNTTMIDIETNEEMSGYHTIGVHEILVLIVGSGSSLLIVLVCSILILASLCKHVYRLKCKEHHSRSIQTKAHVKASGTILFSLFLYISFYVVQTLVMTANVGKIEGTFLTIVVIAYPSAQACILLLVNRKFNQAATQILPRCDT
uniref:Taste receptor type 2 n=1 Tax=Anolis carolinensis TaxID=28377 RepID=A0A803SWI6_ANOCA